MKNGVLCQVKSLVWVSIKQELNGWRDLWRSQLGDENTDCGRSL